ncbi:flippase [soil metagenome]
MFLQKLVLSYASRLLLQLIQMVTGIFVARIVGPGVLGILSFGLAYTAMFSFIADLGLGSAHMKLIAEGKDLGDCIATYSKIKYILIGVYLIVVLSVFSYQKWITKDYFESTIQEYVVLIYLVMTVIGMYFSIAQSTFASKMEQAKQDVPNFIMASSYQVLRLILALIGFGAVALAFSNLATSILVIPIYFFMMKKYPVGNFRMDLAKQYLKIAFPIVIIGIAQTLIYSTDRVILQSLTNSEEVGFYAAAFMLSSFINLIQSSAGTLFFPYLTSNLVAGEFQKINNAIRKFERMNLLFVTPVIILVAILSKEIIYVLYGNKFFKTGPILSLICIGLYISVLYLPYGNLLFGKGKFKEAATLWVVSFAFFAGLSYLFVSPNLMNLSGVGIASALLLTNILIGCGFTYFSAKKIIEVKILPGLNLLIYGVVTGVVGYFLFDLFREHMWMKISFAPFFLLAFWGIAHLTKLSLNEDWASLLEIVNIKKLTGYIRSEFKK